MRVSPKLMADVRDSARTYGKSDPIDALAVAWAALREPDLPDVGHAGDPNLGEHLSFNPTLQVVKLSSLDTLR